MNIPKWVKFFLRKIPFLCRTYSVTYSVPNVPDTLCGGINGEIDRITVLKSLTQDEFAEDLYQVLRKLLSLPGITSMSMTSRKKVIPIIYFGMDKPLPLTCTIRDLETGNSCPELAEKVIQKWDAEFPQLREQFGHMG